MRGEAPALARPSPGGQITCPGMRKASRPLTGGAGEEITVNVSDEDEARTRSLAAEDAKDDHRRECPACGNGRLRERPPCPEGDRPWDLAAARRQAWADAVAARRAAASASSR